MKILISSCLLGNEVRWNGAQKLNKKLLIWCEENNIELVPVCPENELFGTPRAPIRLVQIGEKTRAVMSSKDVTDQLDEKCAEIFSLYPEAAGFIGIRGSPSCGISVGVKNAGKRTKGYMHKVAKIPTVDSNQLKKETQRVIFLKRLQRVQGKTEE